MMLMAFLPVQRGELTDRLRRYFGIVGRYRGDVDTLVSPVVQAQNLDVPPFRQDGIGWSGFATAAAGVGVVNHFNVGPSNPGDVLTVETITINNQNAAAASFLIGAAAGPVSPTASIYSTEQTPAGAIINQVPGGIEAGTAGLPTSSLWRVIVPAASSITLYGLPFVATSEALLRVETAAVNLDLSATFAGRWWRQVNS